MKLGIFAKTYPGRDPAAVLGQVRDAGYAAAQFNLASAGLDSMPDHVPDEAIGRISDAAASAGVELVALSGTYNMIHPDVEVRETGHARLEIVIGAAAALGIPLVTLCTGTRDPADQWRAHPDNASEAAWADLMVSMDRAVVLAERHGVALGVEPELANVVDSTERAARLVELCGPRVRIVLDPANLFEVTDAGRRRALVDEALERLGPHLALAHAKDRRADGRFATAGEGVIDWPHYLGGLRRVGYDGALVTHGLGADKSVRVARFLGGVLREIAPGETRTR